MTSPVPLARPGRSTRAALVLPGYTVNPHTISPETSYDSTATYRLSLGAAGH
jgi:hypothetical protein